MRSLSEKLLSETLFIAGLMLGIYVLKDMLNTYVLIIASLVLFIMSYNIYIFRAAKSPIVLPLWLFPLAWLLSSIIYLFIGEHYVLLTYYFTCLLIISVISKPRIIEKIMTPIKKHYVYVFLALALFAMIYSPRHRLWVSMGSFIEYFLASYFYVEYTSTLIPRQNTGSKEKIFQVFVGLLFSLLSSLMIFVEPWMVIYVFIVNSLKVFSINIKRFVSIILVVDVFIRFLLVGGSLWITGML